MKVEIEQKEGESRRPYEFRSSLEHVPYFVLLISIEYFTERRYVVSVHARFKQFWSKCFHLNKPLPIELNHILSYQISLNNTCMNANVSITKCVHDLRIHCKQLVFTILIFVRQFLKISFFCYMLIQNVLHKKQI